MSLSAAPIVGIGRYVLGVRFASTYQDATAVPYWLDRSEDERALASVESSMTCDRLIVGGGFSGLWSALIAIEHNPRQRVVLVDRDRIGGAATGRNGGFCAASLAHGFANAAARFGDEAELLERMGQENLADIVATIGRLGIACDLRASGDYAVATTSWQLDELRETAELARQVGHRVELLDGAEIQARIHSPALVGGLYDPSGVVMIDPGKLAQGLRDAVIARGVEVFEGSEVTSLRRVRGRIAASTPGGVIDASEVVLATSAAPSLIKRLRRYVIPIYDYVLMTEPLSSDQLESIGWRDGAGLSTAQNQFIYAQLTPDRRILWGGYDAIYHFANRTKASFEDRSESFERLAEVFFSIFPQLEGVTFTHRWAGVIDTCSRFTAFYGTDFDGRVAYASGFTGLGVGSSRFGALVMDDLLAGRASERTALRLTSTMPHPFPPEPFRSVGIAVTRWSLARADRREGRRNVWLRTLDRLGLGFDS